MRIGILSAVCVVLMASCGKMAEENEWKKKQVSDSVALSVVSKVDSKTTKEMKLKMLKDRYDKTKYDYDQARDQLRIVEEYHLMRSHSKKEQQVEKQEGYVQLLRDSLTRMERTIARMEVKGKRK